MPGQSRADERTITCECDVPDGHHASWTATTKANTITITGSLRAKVGEDERSIELGAFVPKSISLGCSTGDFSFSDVRIVEE